MPSGPSTPTAIPVPSAQRQRRQRGSRPRGWPRAALAGAIAAALGTALAGGGGCATAPPPPFAFAAAGQCTAAPAPQAPLIAMQAAVVRQPNREVRVRASTAARALAAALAADLAEDRLALRQELGLELGLELRFDPTLTPVAEAAAWSASVDEVISEAAVRSAMATALRSGLSPHLLTAWIRPEGGPRALMTSDDGSAAYAAVTENELQELHDALARSLRELAAAAPLENFAVSVRSGPAGIVAAIAALEPPRLPLLVEHRDRRAIVTAPWHLLAKPAAYIVTPQRSERLSTAVEGDSVKIVVPCRTPAGDLEVLGQGGVFASIVDVCNPTDPRWAAHTGDVGPAATALVEVEQRSFELMNRERRLHDLPPLLWDERAQEMARKHSRDMAEHRFVSHVGFDGNTLVQRLTEVALPAAQTFENVGRSGGPGEMHFGFMTSAGHRDNLLAATATAGAVGVARDPVTQELYFTQVLYAPKPQLSARR